MTDEAVEEESPPRKAPTFEQGGLSQRLPEPIPHARAASQLHETFRVGGGTSPGKVLGREGTFVSTVGLDEVVVLEYIRNQEKKDKRLEQLNLDWWSKDRISKTAPFRGRQLRPL